ncbi:MAG: exosortase [Acidobacteria bacterium]|nr:MAG: exosortase [Acidobacteriota bacterium]
MTKRTVTALALVTLAATAVYLPVLSSLVSQWASDENYSHGFLIVPFAIYFAWAGRESLAAAPLGPSAAGLIIVCGSLILLIAGLFGAELFLARISLIGVLAGTVLFLFGSQHLRLLAFPIALLVLMVPLPALVFNQIAFPLQLFASRVGELVLTTAGIPVLREGNILELSTTKLEVAQACSGIRSLVSLVTLGVILGKLNEPRRWARAVLAFVAIPIAIVENAARVAGTGVAAHWIGPEAAEGFLHTFSGWVMFVLAFGLLLLTQRALARGWPRAVHGPRAIQEGSGPSTMVLPS